MKKFFCYLVSVFTIMFSNLTVLAEETGRDTGNISVTGDTTITFTNSKSGTVPTGVLTGNTWMYVVLMLVAVAVIAIIIRKRRINNYE